MFLIHPMFLIEFDPVNEVDICILQVANSELPDLFKPPFRSNAQYRLPVVVSSLGVITKRAGRSDYLSLVFSEEVKHTCYRKPKGTMRNRSVFRPEELSFSHPDLSSAVHPQHLPVPVSNSLIRAQRNKNVL